MKDIVEIANSDCNQYMTNDRTRLREIVTFVLKCKSPIVEDICLLEDPEGNFSGHMSFNIRIENLGLNYSLIRKYKKEVFSHVFVDFVAEMILRENLDIFAANVTRIDSDDYKNAVSSFKHEKFGMKMVSDKMRFSFHISLLQDILLEDFKTEIK